MLELLPVGQPRERRGAPEARDGDRSARSILEEARKAAVPAGDALAVDRAVFAEAVTRRLASEPLLELVRAEAESLPDAGRRASSSSRRARSRRRRSKSRSLPALGDAVSVLLRRDGADRGARVARPLEALRALALGQGRRRRLPERPALEARVRGLRERSSSRARRSRSTTSRRPSTSKGAFRSRPWPSAGIETLRHGPMKPFGLRDPAHRARAVRRRAAPAGRPRARALQPRGLPDEAQGRRAEAHLPDAAGARERRVRALRHAPPQHLHQRAGASRRAVPLEEGPAGLLRGPAHGRRGLSRVGGHGPHGRRDARAAPRGPRAQSRSPSRRRSARSRSTSPPRASRSTRP